MNVPTTFIISTSGIERKLKDMLIAWAAGEPIQTAKSKMQDARKRGGLRFSFEKSVVGDVRVVCYHEEAVCSNAPNFSVK